MSPKEARKNAVRKAAIAPNRRNTLVVPSRQLTFWEGTKPEVDRGQPIVNKWIYLFIESKGELYAEIFAEKFDRWHVEYHPSSSKSVKRFDRRTKSRVSIDFNLLDRGEYRVFLSPIRANDEAVRLLKTAVTDLALVKVSGATTDGIPYAIVHDAFHAAENQHKNFKAAYNKWNDFVSDEIRQSRLFIASAINLWMQDGDKAQVGEHLLDKDEPERILREYRATEQKIREKAEHEMVLLCQILDSIEHQVIDLAAQKQGKKELAVGLLHWGIVSQCMLIMAPGRVFANKLMEEEKAIPTTILLGESLHPDLYGTYSTFKKVHAASMSTVLNLLAARVKNLRKSVSPRLKSEKVLLYLRNLKLESKLQGTYKRVHERLESGERITKRLRGMKRSIIEKSYKKLVRRANTHISDFSREAQEVIETANRLDLKHSRIENSVSVFNLFADVISFMDAIEEYREAFPDAKQEKLFATVGAGSGLYSAAAELAFNLSKDNVLKAILKANGGLAGFVSGVFDMLDAEDKAVRSVMHDNNYAAAAGHSITAVGASMSAFAGGILLAEGIFSVLVLKGFAVGAVFGGPFGTIVGLIGAGLMISGMLVVAYFSENDYQTFVRHCFLGRNRGTIVAPHWSTVRFGDLTLSDEVRALYDLMYRFRVALVTVRKELDALPKSRIKWSGLKLTILPQYGLDVLPDHELHDLGKTPRYHVKLKIKYDSPQLKATFADEVVLPDAVSWVSTQLNSSLAEDVFLPEEVVFADVGVWTDDVRAPKSASSHIIRRWTPDEVWQNMLSIPVGSPELRVDTLVGEFELKVVLNFGNVQVGKPLEFKGKIGGPIKGTPPSYVEFKEHHIEIEK